jgi:hypothetical protein
MNVNVHRKKLRLGFIYGIVSGLAFAVFAWGIDALLLVRAHSAYYSIKFIPGLIIGVLAGGLAGWLTVLRQNHALAILLWGLVAVIYTWLAVWLPFSGNAMIINFLNPDLGHWFTFSPVQKLGQFIGLSAFIIGLAAMIGGIIELNLIDQAVLSPYISGSVVAFLVCVILFGLAGSAIDNMINTNLREPVQVIDNLLQFTQDNVGVNVPPETARAMHLSATRQLGDLIQKPRRLLLIGFDADLGTVNILVSFDGTPVNCSTIFSQPINCTILPVNP